VGILGLWYHVVVEVADEFHWVVVVGTGVVAFGCVVEVGWGWFGGVGV
jgi:hypothetical protein